MTGKCGTKEINVGVCVSVAQGRNGSLDNLCRSSLLCVLIEIAVCKPDQLVAGHWYTIIDGIPDCISDIFDTLPMYSTLRYEAVRSPGIGPIRRAIQQPIRNKGKGYPPSYGRHLPQSQSP